MYKTKDLQNFIDSFDTSWCYYHLKRDKHGNYMWNDIENLKRIKAELEGMTEHCIYRLGKAYEFLKAIDEEIDEEEQSFTVYIRWEDLEKIKPDHGVPLCHIGEVMEQIFQDEYFQKVLKQAMEEYRDEKL